MLVDLLQSPIVRRILVLTFGLLFSLTLPANRPEVLRLVILATSFVALFIGLFACLSFDKASLGFQFLYRLDLLPQYNLALTFGVDGLSRAFVRLTLFIFPLCFLAS